MKNNTIEIDSMTQDNTTSTEISQRTQTRTETAERHGKMTRKIIKLKLKPNSQRKRDYLKKLFLEAKWETNHMIHMRKNNLNLIHYTLL